MIGESLIGKNIVSPFYYDFAAPRAPLQSAI